MSEHELIGVLDACGVRSNATARAHLAGQLHARGVSAEDVKRGHAYLSERRRLPAPRASSILASMLATESAWASFQIELRSAEIADKASPNRPGGHEHGDKLKTTVQEIRQRDYKALGLSDADAKFIEVGGYLHARVVGDDKVFGDVCREVSLDPWDSVQAAAWWADIFGDRRVVLRRALTKQIQRKRCAESLLEHLDSVSVREIDREPLRPWKRPEKVESLRTEIVRVRPLTDQEAELALKNIEALTAKHSEPRKVDPRGAIKDIGPMYGEPPA